MLYEKLFVRSSRDVYQNFMSVYEKKHISNIILKRKTTSLFLHLTSQNIYVASMLEGNLNKQFIRTFMLPSNHISLKRNG